MFRAIGALVFLAMPVETAVTQLDQGALTMAKRSPALRVNMIAKAWKAIKSAGFTSNLDLTEFAEAPGAS